MPLKSNVLTHIMNTDNNRAWCGFSLAHGRYVVLGQNFPPQGMCKSCLVKLAESRKQGELGQTVKHLFNQKWRS